MISSEEHDSNRVSDSDEEQEDQRRPKKRCRCSPRCYRTLAYSTRRRHYAKANPAEMLPSGSSDDEPETDVDMYGAQTVPRPECMSLTR